MDQHLIWTLLFGTLPAALWIVMTIHRMEATLKQEIDQAKLQQAKDFLEYRESHEDFHRRLMLLEKKAEEITIIAKKIAGK